MDKKIVRKRITAERENREDRFRTTYGNKRDFTILRVEISRESTGEMLVFEFNAADLTDNDSIHFSTEVVDGNFNVIWDRFIADKVKLV